jgi:hypothetical protein
VITLYGHYLTRTDSLVSSQAYEVIKTIYSSPDSSTSDATRVTVLQNTLGQLRLANIATLDAITTHFTRLIELTSADETYVAQLAQMLAPCILRPRTQSSLTMHERHAYRLVRDLFDHKEGIFGELKRASSQNTAMGGSVARPRTTSNQDESNRRANMEARNRAIASKSRAASPAPSALSNGRTHRRDRSIGPADTRFPVVTSPTAESHKPRTRQSLEVPESSPSTPRADTASPSSDVVSKPLPDTPTANGISEHAAPAVTEEIRLDEPSGIEKKDSLTRRGHVLASAGRLNRKTPGSGSGSGLGMIARTAAQRDSMASTRDSIRDSISSMTDITANSSEVDRNSGIHSVELIDKPMDD